MRRNLVDEKQAFGQVKNEVTMPGQGRPAEMLSKPLGADTVVGNQGMDHPDSMADKNPMAHAQACAHLDNPFFWSGHPKGRA